MRARVLAPPFLSFLLLLLSVAFAGCNGGGGKGGGGQTRIFWAWDLSVMPPEDKEVPATLRRTTEHAYLWVEDTLWEAGDVDDAILDDLEIALEDSTPAGSVNPAQGIFENDIAMFGPVPDELDADPRVYVLLMDIEGFQTFEFDGFFRSLDEKTDEDAVAQDGYHSNEIEMLFINAKIRPANDDTTKSVIAHELFHLLEYGLDPVEDAWLSEAMGEFAMTINGYYTDDEWVTDFMGAPEEPLKGGQFSVHYGACLLWANYLYERFGQPFMSSLAAQTSDGEAAIDAALAAAGAGTTFPQVFLDWVAANGAHAPTAAGGTWGYDFANVPLVTPVATIAANPGTAPATSAGPLSSRYVRLSGLGGTTFNATVVSSTAADARIVLIRYLAADRNVVDVSFPAVDVSNTTVVPVNLSATYDEALLAVVGMSAAQTFTVSVGP